MAREPRIYPPEERRYIADNLLCTCCGNTTAYSIDLRLRHSLSLRPGGLEIGLDRLPTEKLLKALRINLHRVVDRGLYEDRPIIHCGNCGEAEAVDIHERAMDTCWNSGCPGCWWCGNYIEKEEVVQLCSDCIISKEGKVDLEDCLYSCTNYDYGLEGVREHHALSLEELKTELGY
ncbi:hypothetical protein ACFL4U_04245 [Candidatus Neomarinimicrobiota bacterium]